MSCFVFNSKSRYVINRFDYGKIEKRNFMNILTMNSVREHWEIYDWEVFDVPKIGVEESLTNVADALKRKGHEIIALKQESDVKGCDCCVISGLDTNMLGIHETSIDGPIIEASGLSADDVCLIVESRLQQLQH